MPESSSLAAGREALPATMSVIDIQQPLLSVSQLIKKGNAVVMHKDRAYVEIASGIKHRENLRGGVFVPRELGVEEESEEAVEQGLAEVESGRPAKPMRSPQLPSPKEIEAHNVSHIPFRAWCAHLLVERDQQSKALFTHMPSKGVEHVYLEKALVTDIEFLGYPLVGIKCDQEPAIMADAVKNAFASPGDALGTHGQRRKEAAGGPRVTQAAETQAAEKGEILGTVYLRQTDLDAHGCRRVIREGLSREGIGKRSSSTKVRRRDLRRKLLKNRHLPKTHIFNAPCIGPETQEEQPMKIPMWLPHEILAALEAKKQSPPSFFDASQLDLSDREKLQAAASHVGSLNLQLWRKQRVCVFVNALTKLLDLTVSGPLSADMEPLWSLRICMA
eukprot:s526_g28.t1